MNTQSGKNEEPCPCAPGLVLKNGKCVMPDVSFTTFFMALNSSALYHLGELFDPVTGKQQKDMLLAKHTIDTMSMLQSKTRGNLTHEETELVETSLYDLKMRYVKARS
ncbi:MAG: DUF1844 domain-containing protein [Proteobacteria bacterium]|nr:DUF1844 domain-containing protein [Desulfobulbaceae bacterium]MBU4153753.1 DUF1844 domain-containing protein [Pseudomonadota bacterium]